MTKKVYEETDIQNIANAIREKNGLTDTYKVSEMATIIENMPSGGVKFAPSQISFYCGGINPPTPLDLSQLDTSNLTHMYYMFGYYNHSNLDVSGFNTTNVTDTRYTFGATGTNLEVIDLNNWDLSNVKDATGMFSNCKAKRIYMKNFKPINTVTVYQMFNNCTNLSFLDISGFDFYTKKNNTTYFFTGVPRTCKIIVYNSQNKNYIVSNFMGGNTENVKTVEEAISSGWIDANGNYLI